MGMGALAKRLLINQLAAYVAELKSVYSSGSLLPCKDGSPPTPKPTVKHSPQTRPEPGKMKAAEGQENARQISKKPRKRKVKSGSSDFLFYISLVSIVCISAVLVVRMVKAV